MAVFAFCLLEVFALLSLAASQDSLRASSESFKLVDDVSSLNDTFNEATNDTISVHNLTLDDIEIKNKFKEKTKVRIDDYSDNSYFSSENNKTNYISSITYSAFKLFDHLNLNIGKITIEGFNNIFRGNNLNHPIIVDEENLEIDGEDRVHIGRPGPYPPPPPPCFGSSLPCPPVLIPPQEPVIDPVQIPLTVEPGNEVSDLPGNKTANLSDPLDNKEYPALPWNNSSDDDLYELANITAGVVTIPELPVFSRFSGGELAAMFNNSLITGGTRLLTEALQANISHNILYDNQNSTFGNSTTTTTSSPSTIPAHKPYPMMYEDQSITSKHNQQPILHTPPLKPASPSSSTLELILSHTNSSAFHKPQMQHPPYNITNRTVAHVPLIYIPRNFNYTSGGASGHDNRKYDPCPETTVGYQILPLEELIRATRPAKTTTTTTTTTTTVTTAATTTMAALPTPSQTSSTMEMVPTTSVNMPKRNLRG